MLIITRNKTRLKIAIIGAVVAASLAMTPNAAMAAPLDRGGVTHPTDQTASGVSVTKMPDKAALRIASEETSSLKAADPTGFERRVDLISNSREMTKYLRSFSGLDFRLQRDFMAASMPTDALTGLVDMMKKGVIEFKVSKISADSFSSEMIIQKAENQSGAMSSMALGSLPRCASAWAAFWAWFAVNGAMCGAFAPMPPLAFSCAVGFAIGGAIIDFNMSC